MAAVSAGILAVNAPVAAQIGAIGAPGSIASGSEATSSAPIFTESALVMGRGMWAAGAYAGYTSGGFDGPVSVDLSSRQLLLGAYYAPTEQLTLGVSVLPYASISAENNLGDSADESGRGDAQLRAKYQFWNSTDGRTSLAGLGSIGLPIGDDDFGASGASVGLGGAISHLADRVSVHGGLGFFMPTDDDDGETTIDFSAAVVYAAQEKLSLGLELLGSTFSFEGIEGSERYTSIDLAPGARYRVAPRVFLDGGLLFNVSSTDDSSLYDYALVIGATVTR